MNWDKASDVGIVIGFAFAMLSFGLLYLSSEWSETCMATSIQSSIDTNSNNHKIINATTLSNSISYCQSFKISNMDFIFAIFGIVGLTTPVVVPNAIFVIKKYRNVEKKLLSTASLFYRFDKPVGMYKLYRFNHDNPISIDIREVFKKNGDEKQHFFSAIVSHDDDMVKTKGTCEKWQGLVGNSIDEVLEKAIKEIENSTDEKP